MAIVTITGDLASGKSMVAKELIHPLNAEYFSTGQIQRGIAASMGMTTLELNQYSETHPEIDDQIDGQIKELANKNGNFVVDSRMAWHFLPESFKIYLSVDVYRAAERVMKDDQRSSEPAYSSIEDAINKLGQRKGSENKRYIQLYQANCSDMNNFDAVLDSTFSTPQQTLDSILSLCKHWQTQTQQQKAICHYWLSPNHIYPMAALPAPEDIQPGLVSKTPFVELIAIDVIKVDGRFYLYDNTEQLANTIKAGFPHIPVNIIATDDEQVTEGPSAREYVAQNLNPKTVEQWSHGLDCEYLPL